jgi:predicted transcriptional regulator
MARTTSELLTEREAQIMEVVWRFGDATAEQVREAMPDSLHDSTVRTLMRILESKGYLTHEARGKVYVYRAVIEQRNAQRLALKGLLTRFFGGSAEDLVLRLIEDEQLTPEQLDALRKSARPTSRPQRRRKGETP